MAVIMYITTLICVYVATFKNDFKDEDLQKAIPLIVILFALTLISALL